jgi:hypothetical protein
MNMAPYNRRWEQDPPWKKKKSSLFFEDQLQRRSEIRDDPASNLGFFGLNYSDMPWPIQMPMEWFKKQVLEGEARDARYSENIAKVFSGLGESMKEREARLDRERKEAAAEKFEKSQTERRMPTYTPSIEKIDEEEDLMEKYLKYMLVSNLIGAGAAEDYAGTSTVNIGQARDWPTMPPMFG